MAGFTIRRVAGPPMMIGRIGQAAPVRPPSDFKVTDRVLVRAPFWGVCVQASATKVISGPSKPSRKVDPALQNVLEHAYRRRHVAKVIDEARDAVLEAMKIMNPTYAEDMDALRKFRRNVDRVSLADIAGHLSVVELRTLDACTVLNVYVRGVIRLLTIHHDSLRRVLNEASRDVVFRMTRLSELLEGEYQAVGDQAVPKRPEFVM